MSFAIIKEDVQSASSSFRVGVSGAMFGVRVFLSVSGLDRN